MGTLFRSQTDCEIQLYDSSDWILKKKNEFQERLNKYSVVASSSQQEARLLPSAADHRKITVNLRGLESATGKKAVGGSTQSGPTQGTASETTPPKIINTHEWLKCMDAFARNVNQLWTTTRSSFFSNIGSANSGLNQETAFRRESPENEIVVALIDDGVSLLDQNFVGRVLEGKTFDYQEGTVGQSYNSAQGHGTEMARCILRVCPMAKIYPSEPSPHWPYSMYAQADLIASVRLKTHPSSEGKNQIDLESAALVINPRIFSFSTCRGRLSPLALENPSLLTQPVFFKRQYAPLWKRMPA